MTASPPPEHHTPLGRTRWLLWHDVCLRGAGFPAERLLDLCDDELAAAADAVDDRADDRAEVTREQYVKVFAAATDRLSAVIRRTAADPGLREAVAWQNPALVANCLDKAAAGEPRNVRGRYHELAIASYVQRYCLKNDTVGFFGPVGWARITDDDAGVLATAGSGLLAQRTTYFEGWAIDAVAATIAARSDVWPWLQPRVAASAALRGRTLRVPFGKPVSLSVAELRVLGQCDGRRRVRDIAGDPPDPGVMAALLRLRECGAVRIDLGVSLGSRPEEELAERIGELPDPQLRATAGQPLDDLVGARDAVAAAAGDSGAVVRATQALAATFERVTGRAATRRSGGLYAGRTVVYEDTVRAGEVRLGRRLIDQLAAPLGLVMDSAVWLANTIADRYEEAARRALDRECARTGDESVPWLQLVATIMPELGRSVVGRPESAIADDALTDFHRRWRTVLGLPLNRFAETRRHDVAAGAIADAVAHEFATGPARWPGARCNSPDVMVAAVDEDALASGDVDFVLGEMHCASNTLVNQFFVAQHPCPARLRAALEATQRGPRITIVPRLDSPQTTSRMAPARELMLPSFVYLSLGQEGTTPPLGSTVVSALELMVRRHGDELVVYRRDGREEYSFAETAGDALSVLVADRFRPLGGARHLPRVTIDRLVLSRESWTFPAGELDWAATKDERRRYLLARRWRMAEGLPERGFVRVPVEQKPMAVDFRSLPLVNLLAKSIRRTVEAGSGPVTISEMLPDLDRLWLRDGQGRTYTAEFRFVAVDGTSTGLEDDPR